MTFRLAVFDLDGTLVDSRADLCAAVAAMRRHFRLAPLDDACVARAVGDGARELARRCLEDAPDIDVDDGLSRLMAAYRDAVCVHSRVYDGIPELLDSWKSRGIRMAVLTNKPQELSDELLSRLGLTPYFDPVWGPEVAGCRKPAPQGLLSLIARCAATPAETAMLGDHHTDSRAARAAGCRYLHFSGGLGRLESEDAAPDRVYSSPRELIGLPEALRLSDGCPRGTA